MHSLDLTPDADRRTVYAELVTSLRALVADEPDLIANLANIVAVLKQALPGASWVGFYRKIGPELVLGPFQGKLACTRIGPGQGVCGAAAERRATVLVPDVAAFPGHIACDSASRSEIVVPIVKRGQVVAVLDLDSEALDHLAALDAEQLGQVAALVAELAW